MRHSINDKKQVPAPEKQERRCEVCGRRSKNYYSEEDGLGRAYYCVCSRCMVERGDADAVKLARGRMKKR